MLSVACWVQRSMALMHSCQPSSCHRPCLLQFFSFFVSPFLAELFPFGGNDFQVEIQIVDMRRSVLVMQVHEKLAQSNDGPCSDPNILRRAYARHDQTISLSFEIRLKDAAAFRDWRTACDLFHLHFQCGLLIPTQLLRSVLLGLLFVPV